MTTDNKARAAAKDRAISRVIARNADYGVLRWYRAILQQPTTSEEPRVCMFVCLLVHSHVSKMTSRLHKLSADVTNGCGSLGYSDGNASRYMPWFCA